MILQVKKRPITRSVDANLHRAFCTFASWQKVSESDAISDGNPPSYDNLVHIVEQLQETCTKQQSKIKELKQKLARSIKNYDEFASKFDIFTDYNVELANKLEKLEANSSTPKNT